MGLLTDIVSGLMILTLTLTVGSFFNPLTAFLIYAVGGAAFIYYALIVKDRLNETITKAVGAGLFGAAFYNLTIFALTNFVPGFAQIALTVISLGTWKFLIAITVSLMLDGIAVSLMADNIRGKGKFK